MKAAAAAVNPANPKHWIRLAIQPGGGHSAECHPGVRSATVYPHFQNGVWIVILGVAFLA